VATTHDASAKVAQSATMASDCARTLTLEIDPGSDPICGRLREGPDAKGEEFVGWLGLARALERALEAGPPASAGGPPLG
jgi:hypothetical protein